MFTKNWRRCDLTKKMQLQRLEDRSVPALFAVNPGMNIGPVAPQAPAAQAVQAGTSLESANPDTVVASVAPTIRSVFVNDRKDPQRSRVESITVVFNQQVSLPANLSDAFSLRRAGDDAVVKLNGKVIESSRGTSIRFDFVAGAVDGNSLADGRYILTAFAPAIHTNGIVLDGNGDGIAGDNYIHAGSPGTAVNLFRLFGDSDGDGKVGNADLAAFQQVFNGKDFELDWNGDGVVSASDFIQFRRRFNGSI